MLGQICVPIASPQAELCAFKAIKLNVQIRPIFTDPVTNISEVVM